jgi:ZIP family zinc transporter
MKEFPVLFAFVLGAASQLSLVLSAVSVYLVKIPTRLVGALAAFGAGALIAAVSRDLLPEAHERAKGAGLWTVVGLCASFAMGS